MTANINNFGVINFYENNAPKQEPTKNAQPVCEDIEPVQVKKPTNKGLFPRITKHAHELGKAQEVDDELRSASVSAPKLVKTINTNEALGYLDTQNLSSTDLYNLLDMHYGLKFGLSNFRKYRK